MPPARDTVLLLTHGGDHSTVDRVAEGLSRRGAIRCAFDFIVTPEGRHV
jgi:hypothetical protein